VKPSAKALWRRRLAWLPHKLFVLLCLALTTFGIWLATEPPASPGHARFSAIRVESLSLDQLKEFFPDASRLGDPISEVGTAARPPRPVQDHKGNILGYVCSTSPFSDERMGYGGTVPVLVALDPEGRVQSVKLHLHKETESFVDRLEEDGFFRSWNGLTLSQVAEAPVDAVSGATLTSLAVIRNVAEYAAATRGVELASSGTSWTRVARRILAFGVLLIALASFLFPRPLKRWRLGLLAASVLILGFGEGALLSLALFRGWLSSGISWSSALLPLALFLPAVLLPLATSKPFYCVYVCPFGAAQELMGRLGLPRWSIPSSLEWLLKHSRRLYATLLTGLLLMGITVDLANVEPFAAFLVGGASMSVVVLAVGFLILSLFVNRPWCRYGCPTGEVLDLLKLKGAGNTNRPEGESR
jgi:hypothetical protein